MSNNNIPILYCYIYRNIKNGYYEHKLGTEVAVKVETVIPLMRKVVHTCPKVIQNEILKEMETMGLIRMIGCDRIIILNNKDCEKKLKEYVFPIHP